MDKGPRYRDTVLPFSLQPTSGSLVTSTLAPAPELDETEEHGAESPSKAEDDTSSSLQPRLLRKKRKETVHPSQDVTDVKANPNVGPPNRTTKAATESEVWQKYRRFWESDQAGKGIVAHDNSIEHNIVVIKKFKMHASRSQHEQLLRVMANIADSILKPQRQSYSDDIHDIGTLLVSFKEPGTFRRNPKGLLLEKDDVSEHCKRFIQETATSSLKQLINVSYQAKEKLGKDNMLIFQSMISSSNLPDQVG
ncbi:hypothetical protein ACP6JB_002514 [Aspergillus fumigatus]